MFSVYRIPNYKRNTKDKKQIKHTQTPPTLKSSVAK